MKIPALLLLAKYLGSLPVPPKVRAIDRLFAGGALRFVQFIPAVQFPLLGESHVYTAASDALARYVK
jgi:hypothetical protein